jgi:hypothetical protein
MKQKTLDYPEIFMKSMKQNLDFIIRNNTSASRIVTDIYMSDADLTKFDLMKLQMILVQMTEIEEYISSVLRTNNIHKE